MTKRTAHAYAVFRLIGWEAPKLQRVKPLVFARDAHEAIKAARGPFNVSPIVELVARGAL
jgi:hypothetical protein